MEYTTLLYQVENRIAKITLNVPEKMNALDKKISMELTAVLQEIKNDDNVKVVIITGTGRAFCAGGDISFFKTLDLEGSIEFVKAAQSLVGAFINLPKPIIAAVNGFALGAGLSLALLSDIVISSDKAKFAAAFVNVGLVPDLGALYFLSRLTGLQKAKELVFTGKNFDAEEASRIGIVNIVVEHEKLEAAVSELSEQLAGKPAIAMASAKRLLNMGMDLGIDELLEIEAFAQSRCMQTEDCKEAVDAFLNKRKPVFK
ncbi:Short-chain-enoyl-CoA hydratase [Sporomusa silvacetica DSM 10669]|uniref:Short-chain-enoyl-CoA hydratase n=1 Tax=Sporomusa silvacetica DSM 10669 TaxID=1123289 RepID=A0ABZ3IKN8_9FIRM|nr:enoyl-CoA hydratase/isomerase family protein [Sporomusa silvacetica]OZC13438.1 putative enoyl-CoA hydratase echA8 [Sporomusa silvacetica DSM 10669]